MIIQQWRAQNDVNGNPRRIFVIYADTGEIVGAVDEGYNSEPSELRGFAHLPSVKISATEYKQLLRQFEDRGADILRTLRAQKEEV